MGGGPTAPALMQTGWRVATAAIAVGGRLLVEDAKGSLIRIEEPVREIARSLGIELALGQPLAAPDRERIVARMVSLIMRMIDRRPADELMGRLLVTEPWPAMLAARNLDA